jgi:hypothetical protein
MWLPDYIKANAEMQRLFQEESARKNCMKEAGYPVPPPPDWDTILFIRAQALE